MSAQFPALYFDSSAFDSSAKHKPDREHAQDASESRKSDPSLCCAQCSQPVTTLASACDILGQHHHRYRNSYGHLFEFQTYRAAPGCMVSGEPTLEYSWFSGYYWQYASCRQCHSHLGWYFFSEKRSNEESEFFGLIEGQVQPCKKPDEQ